MEEKKLYRLSKLRFGYQDLEPYISEKQLFTHHQKHHRVYVEKANEILKEIDQARRENRLPEIKSVLKSLSFNIGGHILHSLFWRNLQPAGKNSAAPENTVKNILEEEFGSFSRFQEEFSQAAFSVEGSGWAALTYCPRTKRPLICQIEKHNLNLYPGFKILLVLDVWEHAYYLDYQNDRKKYVENFWPLVNWAEVAKRLAI